MLPNGVKEEDLGPVGRMWVRAILAQQEADRITLLRLSGGDPMQLHAYIRFPTIARVSTAGGENPLVVRYHRDIRTLWPIHMAHQPWFAPLVACWPSDVCPDSLNVTFTDHRGEHLDQVLNGLRQAISEHEAIHTFRLSDGQVVPDGHEIPHPIADATPGAAHVVLPFRRSA